MSAPAQLPPNADIVRVTLIVGLLVGLGLVLWMLADVALLGFGAIIAATVLLGVSRLIEGVTPLRLPWSLILAGLAIAVFTLVFGALLGTQLWEQAKRVIEELPVLLQGLGDYLGIPDLYERASEWTDGLFAGGTFSDVAAWTSGVALAVGNGVVAIAAGVFLAARPERYRRGVLKLVPAPLRSEAGYAIDHAGYALRRWLLGQLVGMAIVGTATTIGLYAIGVPSALALGFIAGILEFVPFVGPVFAAIPALLVAVNEGGLTPLWVLLLYLVVQQAEGNFITPVIYRHVVDLPPAVTLFSLIAMGVLFGPLGVLLSAPLTIVLYVLVKQLYIRDTLHEATRLPGEDGTA